MNVFQAIEPFQDAEWEWGVFDCCQFARKVLIELHGIDFAEGQPSYSTAFGAAKILARAGGMEGFVSSILGEPIPRNLVKKGDVCIADFPNGIAAGICCGQNAAFASGRGLIYVPMEQVIKGWSCRKL